MASQDPITFLESGELKFSNNEMSLGARTAHNMPPTSLRKKSDLSMGLRTRVGSLRKLLDNLLEVLLGTKLSVFFVAIPFAIVAERRNSSAPWVFALSLVGLIPLAERVSFLTEQIAIHTGPTVGGLLNATCGNATELIISIFALINNRVDVVKYSLFGSILSNLLLVLGSSLICGGIANISKRQKFNKKQVDVYSLLLMLGLLCHVLPLMIKYAGKSPEITAIGTLELSRASSIIMLVAYFVSLFFQLSTNRKFFQTQQDGGDEENDDDDNNDVSEESPTVGFWSGLIWLALMTGVVAFLSEYVVATIEAASVSWGLSVNFTSVILLPIVGNAVEHAAAIIFALRNKLDITLGVALGSATQIAMFVVPLSVVISWIIGVKMDLDLSLLETIALALSILVTTFALQDGTSHYVKGLVLLLCYLVIGACFFIVRAPLGANFGLRSSHVGSNFS